ncbi:MAG: amidophosphoribosyltransferase [Spirochaetia bacterium]
MNYQEDHLKHYCGVAGIFSGKIINIPEKLFFPLFSLQHRGQESAGIAYRKENRTVTYKDAGMVSEVLSRYLTEEHPSQVGIGHTRYSTHGGNKIENVQPLLVNCNKGDIAIAHNGNIANTRKVKDRLVHEGSIFQTSSDTEIILHLISKSRQNDFHSALKESLAEIEGAYSMVMLHDDSLIAVRDPMGFRPLYIGFGEDIYAVASETCGLDILGISEYREVKPGEIITINNAGITSDFLPRAKTSQCVFELIYFARPDSKVFNESVYLARKKMGRALAQTDRESDIRGDVVVPVPDSGNIAAIGYAEESGVPFDLSLTRNHYAGRSFIMPTNAGRELVVRMKLHPVVESIKGKRVILVDDSLVRGTTAKILVDLIRKAGAREIHLRLSSPEIRWSCFFGIDTPTRKELISNWHSPEKIAEDIGADSVIFLSIPKLMQCFPDPEKFCYACFNGEYPCRVSLDTRDELSAPVPCCSEKK